MSMAMVYKQGSMHFFNYLITSKTAFRLNEKYNCYIICDNIVYVLLSYIILHRHKLINACKRVHLCVCVQNSRENIYLNLK